jgi:hypothetical protein
LAADFGGALRRSEALQRQLSAWITNEPGNITPEQGAAMFWAQDNRWQAAFFNAMQDVATASFEASPPSFGYLGVPAGEGQWCWLADHLNDSGFETIEAMYEHAKTVRDSGSRSESEDSRSEAEAEGRQSGPPESGHRPETTETITKSIPQERRKGE